MRTSAATEKPLPCTQRCISPRVLVSEPAPVREPAQHAAANLCLYRSHLLG
jgi:hypothetical protein